MHLAALLNQPDHAAKDNPGRRSCTGSVVPSIEMHLAGFLNQPGHVAKDDPGFRTCTGSVVPSGVLLLNLKGDIVCLRSALFVHSVFDQTSIRSACSTQKIGVDEKNRTGLHRSFAIVAFLTFGRTVITILRTF